jgi:hypothetical protein
MLLRTLIDRKLYAAPGHMRRMQRKLSMLRFDPII